jgi:hypothetical protein
LFLSNEQRYKSNLVYPLLLLKGTSYIHPFVRK